MLRVTAHASSSGLGSEASARAGNQGTGREKALGPGKAGPALDLEPGALGPGPSSVSETPCQYFLCTGGDIY